MLCFLYYLRIVVIKGYRVDSSQIARFPLASPRLPVGQAESESQLGAKKYKICRSAEKQNTKDTKDEVKQA